MQNCMCTGTVLFSTSLLLFLSLLSSEGDIMSLSWKWDTEMKKKTEAHLRFLLLAWSTSASFLFFLNSQLSGSCVYVGMSLSVWACGEVRGSDTRARGAHLCKCITLTQRFMTKFAQHLQLHCLITNGCKAIKWFHNTSAVVWLYRSSQILHWFFSPHSWAFVSGRCASYANANLPTKQDQKKHLINIQMCHQQNSFFQLIAPKWPLLCCSTSSTRPLSHFTSCNFALEGCYLVMTEVLEEGSNVDYWLTDLKHAHVSF